MSSAAAVGAGSPSKHGKDDGEIELGEEVVSGQSAAVEIEAGEETNDPRKLLGSTEKQRPRHRDSSEERDRRRRRSSRSRSRSRNRRNSGRRRSPSRDRYRRRGGSRSRSRNRYHRGSRRYSRSRTPPRRRGRRDSSPRRDRRSNSAGRRNASPRRRRRSNSPKDKDDKPKSSPTNEKEPENTEKPVAEKTAPPVILSRQEVQQLRDEFKSLMWQMVGDERIKQETVWEDVLPHVEKEEMYLKLKDQPGLKPPALFEQVYGQNWTRMSSLFKRMTGNV